MEAEYLSDIGPNPLAELNFEFSAERRRSGHDKSQGRQVVLVDDRLPRKEQCDWGHEQGHGGLVPLDELAEGNEIKLGENDHGCADPDGP